MESLVEVVLVASGGGSVVCVLHIDENVLYGFVEVVVVVVFDVVGRKWL